MDLDEYVKALRKQWRVVVLFTAIGFIGASLYAYLNGTVTAEVSVAVLEPAVTKAVNGVQAQINFASVAESYKVSDRVVARYELDMPAEALQNSVSVRLSRTLVPSTVTPLYIVQVKHPDPRWAVFLANAIVSEAGEAFIELNMVDADLVDAALQPQADRIRADLEVGQEELRAFEEANGVWKLPEQIDAQLALINFLRGPARLSSVTDATRGELEARLEIAQAELDRLNTLLPQYQLLAFDAQLAATTVAQLTDARTAISLQSAGVTTQLRSAEARWEQAQQALVDFQRNIVGVPPATDDSDTELDPEGVEGIPPIFDFPSELASQRTLVTDLRLQLLALQISTVGFVEALAPEEAELSRLLSFLPEFERLSQRVVLAETWLALIEARKVDYIINGSFAPAAQIKVLDLARIQRDLLGTLVPIVLSTVLGGSAGLLLAYMIEYFDRAPQSQRHVNAIFGGPVLAQVPNAFPEGTRIGPSNWWSRVFSRRRKP